MFIVDIRWSREQSYDDSFSYDSFTTALKETERFLEGVVLKPREINVYEGVTKNDPCKKLIASLRTLR